MERPSPRLQVPQHFTLGSSTSTSRRLATLTWRTRTDSWRAHILIIVPRLFQGGSIGHASQTQRDGSARLHVADCSGARRAPRRAKRK
eukprot:3207082-Pyramimonas_sp.AAC.1